MNTYKVTLEVDEQWLDAIKNLLSDVYEGELASWIKIERIGE